MKIIKSSTTTGSGRSEFIIEHPEVEKDEEDKGDMTIEADNMRFDEEMMLDR